MSSREEDQTPEYSPADSLQNGSRNYASSNVKVTQDDEPYHQEDIDQLDEMVNNPFVQFEVNKDSDRDRQSTQMRSGQFNYKENTFGKSHQLQQSLLKESSSSYQVFKNNTSQKNLDLKNQINEQASQDAQDILNNQNIKNFSQNLQSNIEENYDLQVTEIKNLYEEQNRKLALQNEKVRKQKLEQDQLIKKLKHQIQELQNQNQEIIKESEKNQYNTLIEVRDRERSQQQVPKIDQNIMNELEMSIRFELEKIYNEKCDKEALKLQQEMLDFEEKLKQEVQEMLVNKGITNQRIKDIEEEVREFYAQKYQQENEANKSHFQSQALSSQQSHVSILADGQLQQPMSNQEIKRYKESLNKEFERKQRLLELNNKKKLEDQRKRLIEKITKEQEDNKNNGLQELKKEKNEIARLRALENVKLKKLKEAKVTVQSQVSSQKAHYEAIIQNLRVQLEEVTQVQQTQKQELMQSYEEQALNSRLQYQNQQQESLQLQQQAQFQQQEDQDLAQMQYQEDLQDLQDQEFNNQIFQKRELMSQQQELKNQNIFNSQPIQQEEDEQLSEDDQKGQLPNRLQDSILPAEMTYLQKKKAEFNQKMEMLQAQQEVIAQEKIQQKLKTGGGNPFKIAVEQDVKNQDYQYRHNYNESEDLSQMIPNVLIDNSESNLNQSLENSRIQNQLRANRDSQLSQQFSQPIIQIKKTNLQAEANKAISIALQAPGSYNRFNIQPDKDISSLVSQQLREKQTELHQKIFQEAQRKQSDSLHLRNKSESKKLIAMIDTEEPVKKARLTNSTQSLQKRNPESLLQQYNSYERAQGSFQKSFMPFQNQASKKKLARSFSGSQKKLSPQDNQALNYSQLTSQLPTHSQTKLTNRELKYLQMRPSRANQIQSFKQNYEASLLNSSEAEPVKSIYVNQDILNNEAQELKQTSAMTSQRRLDSQKIQELRSQALQEPHKVNGLMQQVFKISNKDDQRCVEYKNLRKRIEIIQSSDQQLVVKVCGKFTFLTSSYVPDVCDGSESTKEAKVNYLRELMKDIDTQWKMNCVSYRKRLQMLEMLEQAAQFEEFERILKVEIDFLENKFKQTEDLIQLLKKREMYKAYIESISGRFKTLADLPRFNQEASSSFSGLRQLNAEIIKLVERRRRGLIGSGLRQQDWAEFRDNDIGELLRLDLWEEEYLKKLEIETQVEKKFASKTKKGL